MKRQPLPVVGIIGSIGSGKSTVAAALAERLGGCRLDADAAGHAVLQDPKVKRQLHELFGSEILAPDGEIHRPALARRVFGPSAEHKAAKARLEAVVHPRIGERLHEEIDQLTGEGRCALILLDAPVMLEAHWDRHCDLVLCIDADRAVRIQRVASRGWDEAELDRREASQIAMEIKRARADLTVDNSGELEATVRHLVRSLQQRFPTLKSTVMQTTPH